MREWHVYNKLLLTYLLTKVKTVKTENGPISRGSQSEVSMCLWGKRFAKKASFEFRVKE